MRTGRTLTGVLVLAVAVGATAWAPAWALTSIDLLRLQGATDDLVGLVAGIRGHAAAARNRFTLDEERADAALERLDVTARRLRDSIPTYPSGREEVLSTLERLEDDGRIVDRTIHRSRLLEPVVGDWERARALLTRIRSTFDTSDDRTGARAAGTLRVHTGLRYESHGRWYWDGKQWVPIADQVIVPRGTLRRIVQQGVLGEE